MLKGAVTLVTGSVCFIETGSEGLVALHGPYIEPFPFSMIASQFDARQVAVGDAVILQPPWCIVGANRVPVRAIPDCEVRGVPVETVSDAAIELVEEFSCRVPDARELGRLIESALVSGDIDRWSGAISSIIGRGPGLTPSGDDILVGLALGMVSRPSGKEHTRALRSKIAQLLPGQTTDISLAMLKAAATGRFPPALVGLGKSLAVSDEVRLQLMRVARIGASSGSDIITGFAIWLRNQRLLLDHQQGKRDKENDGPHRQDDGVQSRNSQR